VTTLSFTVTRVEAGAVRYVVRSTTAEPGGKVLSRSEVEETHDAFPAALPPDAAAETATAAGRSLRAWRARVGETTVWWSPDVPLTGVVRSEGPGGAEQTLVAWSRGG
jgi:hypothetical protein